MRTAGRSLSEDGTRVRPVVRGAFAIACFAACLANGSHAAGAPKRDAGTPRTIDKECPVCEGDGLLKEIGCSSCRGMGNVRAKSCSACTGSGRVTYNCPYCDGKGEVSAGGKSRECPGCKGKGSLPCLACGGKGTIKTANPEAAGGPTTDCSGCSATGFVQKERCRRCGGRGNHSFTTGVVATGTPGAQPQNINNNQNRETVTFDCTFCGGDGEGPPLCRSCHGKGYVGSDKSPRPCRACFATGREFRKCRSCAGMGWVREAKR